MWFYLIFTIIIFFLAALVYSFFCYAVVHKTKTVACSTQHYVGLAIRYYVLRITVCTRYMHSLRTSLQPCTYYRLNVFLRELRTYNFGTKHTYFRSVGPTRSQGHFWTDGPDRSKKNSVRNPTKNASVGLSQSFFSPRSVGQSGHRSLVRPILPEIGRSVRSPVQVRTYVLMSLSVVSVRTAT